MYCLFLAPKISKNLSNSFRNYFFAEDKEILKTLYQCLFNNLQNCFPNCFKKLLTPFIFKDIFDNILKNKENQKTNEWLMLINNTIDYKVKNL